MSRNAGDIIVIDVDKIATRMAKRGFNRETIGKDEWIGWTDSLMDVLEELYQIETRVVDGLKED